MTRIVGWRAVGVIGMMMVMASVLHAQQPTVVVSLRGVDELLSDADFLGAEVGQPGMKGIAESLITAFTGGKGLAGVDRTKPLGFYWNARAGGAPEMPVVFLPVSKAGDLKDLLTDLTPDFEDDKGEWSMTVNGTKLFAKVSNGYCFASIVPTTLTRLPDPTKFVNSKYDVALDVNFASIPQEIKDLFLQQVEQKGREALDSGPPPSSDAEAKGREFGFTATLGLLKSLINEGNQMTYGIDVNRKTRLAAVDVSLTGQPNTGLAKAMTAYGKIQPVFAAVGSESAPLRWVASFPTTGILEQLDDVLKSVRTEANAEIEKDARLKTPADRAQAKNLASRLLDIFEATAKSGTMDSVVVLEPAEDDEICLIAGVKVARGDDAGKLLDDVMKLSNSPEFGKVKLDAAKHAGARIHEIETEFDDDAQKYFGEGPSHLAIRNDSLWLSFGGDNLTAMKKALDQSGKTAAKGGSPISLRVKPATLATIMEKNDEALIERAKAIAGTPGDMMNLDLAPIPGGAKLRLEFNVDLFKLSDAGEREND
jgi:hypothetical protein